MQITCKAGKLPDIAVDSLVIFTARANATLSRALKDLDTAANGAVSTLRDSEEFTGSEKDYAVIVRPPGYAASRVILVGMGERKKIDHDSFRRAAGRVSTSKAIRRSRSAAFYIDGFSAAEYFQATVEGYILGAYELLDFKSGDDSASKQRLEAISFIVDRAAQTKKTARAVERGQIIAEGQVLVRTLADTPANFLTPSAYAETVKALARKHKFSCKVLDEKVIMKEKMGALMSVARGSIEPPRFLVMEYQGGRAGQKPVVLVGKGVTFDSGGISLKPGLNMHEMKGDMAGSAVVVATMVTAARLKLPVHIVGLTPLTENMPSGVATKPGDIVTSRKGKTIEVINTDAEGRLILADALDYANNFKPQAVIDIATLTGASLYILGYAGAPIMGNHDNLIKRLEKAAGRTAERVWRLPIWEEHRDQMKSAIADLVNSGGRPAGTVAAGAFLENFIGDWPWAHVDIAYVDVEPNGKPYVPKGTTGFGLRLFIEMLTVWKKL